jgi:hypothetical protein
VFTSTKPPPSSQKKNIKIPVSTIVHQKATATFTSAAVRHITVFIPFYFFLTNAMNLARYGNSDLGTCNVLTIYYSGDEITNNEVSWACSMNDGKEKCIKCFGLENLNGHKF